MLQVVVVLKNLEILNPVFIFLLRMFEVRILSKNDVARQQVTPRLLFSIWKHVRGKQWTCPFSCSLRSMQLFLGKFKYL